MNASASATSQPQQQGPPLDALALAKLQELDPDGRSGIVGRVLKTYDTALADSLGRLASALAARHAADIRQAAHKLKSSSASVGALALSGLCGEVEHLALEGWHETLPRLVEALLAEGRRVQSALACQLGDPGRR